MGHLFFYLAVIAACLLWSAAFTAAAARTRPGWIRWILIAVAVAVPVLAVAPWVLVTAMLAFGARLETNWFAPTLTAAIAAAIGGVWITRTGLAPRAAPAAAVWPLVGLAAMCVLANAVAAGTLLLIDNAIMAEVRAARTEVVAVMQSVVPPVLPADEDAAPLYRQAFERIEIDKGLTAEQSPLKAAVAADVSTDEVTALLARHATTLDLLRRAAAKPGCRFARDWSRPSFGMLLPELASIRHAARLLALAARREATSGDVSAALADVVRLHRMAIHVAAEPILISGLVETAVDSIALETLAVILPLITAKDAAALADPALGDFVRSQPSFERHALGEEAFGLATFADLAEAKVGLHDLGTSPDRVGFAISAASILYRCFLLPSDLAAYRGAMSRWRAQAARPAMPDERSAEIAHRAQAIDDELMKRRGLLTSLLTPALGAILKTQAKSLAKHRAAEVLLAATRARLKSGEQPGSAESLVPEWLLAVPADPFRDEGSLTVKTGADGWLVYSVGPDGEDDGGPGPAGAAAVEGNDDVGLRLTR
ncbi:MAG: hypothetical protein WCO90_00505 [Planctomycetota bacterium]